MLFKTLHENKPCLDEEIENYLEKAEQEAPDLISLKETNQPCPIYPTFMILAR